MISRLAVLPDDRKVLLGVDKANIFKPGVVYDIKEFDGGIILTPIGEYSLPKQGAYPCELSETNTIVCSGLHLITKEEQEAYHKEKGI